MSKCNLLYIFLKIFYVTERETQRFDAEFNDDASTVVSESDSSAGAESSVKSVEPMEGAEEKEEDSGLGGLSFAGLPWEIECTEETAKTLSSDRVLNLQQRRKVLGRLHRIASGDWNLYNARRVKTESRNLGKVPFPIKF